MSNADIKMSDMFDLPISHDMDELRDCHGKELAAFNTCKQDEYAAHAINSHDALVEQNKALNEVINEIRAIVTEVQDGFGVTARAETLLKDKLGVAQELLEDIERLSWKLQE